MNCQAPLHFHQKQPSHQMMSSLASKSSIDFDYQIKVFQLQWRSRQLNQSACQASKQQSKIFEQSSTPIILLHPLQLVSFIISQIIFWLQFLMMRLCFYQLSDLVMFVFFKPFCRPLLIVTVIFHRRLSFKSHHLPSSFDRIYVTLSSIFNFLNKALTIF